MVGGLSINRQKLTGNGEGEVEVHTDVCTDVCVVSDIGPTPLVPFYDEYLLKHYILTIRLMISLFLHPMYVLIVS